jgi:periplasmic protein TonB
MPRVDVLDEREGLGFPLLTSLGLHGAIFAGLLVSGYIAKSAIEQWGDPKSLGGGSVGITPVAKIPLPSRAGVENRVANDSESVIPTPPKPQPKPQVKVEPDAIPIKSRTAPKRPNDTVTAPQKYTSVPDARPNQVYSSVGQAAVSPMFSLAPGGGGVGSGSANPFGYGFGWYAQLIRDKVARNWHTEQVDPRLRTAPDVVVVFDLNRDGSTRNIHIGQPSGNFALDQSALRAVAQASPFQPFPPNMTRDSYTIDLVFQLKR